MKILYINYLYDTKYSSVGSLVHVQELAKALKTLNHEIKVCFLNKFICVEDAEKRVVREFLKKLLSKYIGVFNSIISNIFYFLREWNLVLKEKPDILLVRYNIFNFSIAIICKIFKIPFILEINAPMVYEKKKFSNHVIKLSFIGWFLERLMIRYADIVYVVSSQLKQFYIQKNVPSHKIHVIYNGADEKRINPSIISKKVEIEYKLQQKNVLGFIGSFHYWHGMEKVQSFILDILSTATNTVFLMVGDGPLKNSLEYFVKKHKITDKVFFTGYVEYNNIPLYLSVMDIVLAPYPKHDFFYYSPIKLFEYMAAGKSVIAPAIGQIKEIINDGVNGILFKAGDYEEMLNKSILLLQDNILCKKIGKEARKTIENNYTWKHTARKLDKIIKSEFEKTNSGVYGK